MWLRNNLTIWPEWFIVPIQRLNKLLPGGEIHEINTTQSDRDVNNLFEKTAPHVSFTPKEENRGMAELKNWGIPDEAKIVLVHSRDAKHLETIFPEKKWYYHNFRDSNIRNFSKAVEVLCDKGCYVFRMGAVVEKQFAIESPFFFDYGFKLRSEFMDIFLSSLCHFYIGDSCGLNALSAIFRRPIATTNLVPIEYALTWGKQDLFIPKKYWSLQKNRLMTLSEIIASGAGKFLATQKYEDMGIRLIENTPEEIAELGIEMFDRLNSQWKSNEKDEELQNRFWEIFPKDAVNETNGQPMHGEIRARIGTHFLRNNPEFLQ